MAGVGADPCRVVVPADSFETCREDDPLPCGAIATRIVRCPLPSPPPVAPPVRDAPLRARQVEAPREDLPLVGDHRALGRARLLNAVDPARRRRVRGLERHVTARNVVSNDPRARHVRRRVPLVSAKNVLIAPLADSSETSVVRVLPPRAGPPPVRVDEVNVPRPATESRVPTSATLAQARGRLAVTHAVTHAVSLAVGLVGRGAIRTRAANEEVVDPSLRARVATLARGRVEHLVSSAPRRSRRSVRTPTGERRVGGASLERVA